MVASLPSDLHAVIPIKTGFGGTDRAGLPLPATLAMLTMLASPAQSSAALRPCHEVGRNGSHLNDAPEVSRGTPRLHIRPGDACVIDQDVDLAERFQRGLRAAAIAPSLVTSTTKPRDAAPSWPVALVIASHPYPKIATRVPLRHEALSAGEANTAGAPVITATRPVRSIWFMEIPFVPSLSCCQSGHTVRLSIAAKEASLLNNNDK